MISKKEQRRVVEAYLDANAPGWRGAQSGAAVVRPQPETTPSLVIACIEDLPPYEYAGNRKGVKYLKGKKKHLRRGHGEVEVVEQHKEDQNILAGIYGKATLEEDFIDISTGTKIREYKPNVTSGDVHAAIGKLVCAKNAYLRKRGILPELGFVTRRPLSLNVLTDFYSIGATVEYLTKDNRVVTA